MWVSNSCWSCFRSCFNCWCSNWSGGRARVASNWSCIAASVASCVASEAQSTMMLLSEDLVQEARLLESAWVVTSGNSARITSGDFNATGWSCVAWIARSDFNAASWCSCTWITSSCTLRLELALESNELALQVTLEALESVKNWSANFAANSCVARIARSDLYTTAWNCWSYVAWSNFNAAGWVNFGSAWSDFNAAAWVSNNSVTA